MKRAVPPIVAVALVAIAGWWWMQPVPSEEPSDSGGSLHDLMAKQAPQPHFIQSSEGLSRRMGRAFRGKRSHLLNPPTTQATTGSSVVIVTWDTVRSDHTGPYGYPRATTPALDRIAADGLVFEDFVVPQATTLPTHVSLFTGTHPEEHGVIGNSAYGQFRFVPPETLPTLAQHLHNEGYTTAGFVSSSPLKAYSGINAGFQVWSEPKRRSRYASFTTADAIDWLDTEPPDGPFFLWIHTYDPHAPYRSQAAHAGRFTDDDPSSWLAERGLDHRTQVPSDTLRNWHDEYDREVVALDEALGTLDGALRDRGYGDAVFVVVGDHGEGMGQHGHQEHGLVWPEQLHAPFVVRAPGLAPGRVEGLTSASDLLPLLAAIAELPNEEALLKQVSGEDPRVARPRSVLSRSSLRQLSQLAAGGGQEASVTWSITNDTWFYRYRPEADDELYARHDDPHALANVADDHPDVLHTLRDELKTTREHYAQRASQLGSGRKEQITAETLEDLEALGYVH